jgi:hypothetical protein
MGAAPRQGKVQPQSRKDHTAKARAASIKARKARADARAAEVAPIIAGLWAAGVTSASDIAEALKERGVRTPTGKLNWYPVQVRLLLAPRRARIPHAATPPARVVRSKPWFAGA